MQTHRRYFATPGKENYKPGSKFTSFELADKTVVESRATMTAKYVCAGSNPLTVPLRRAAAGLGDTAALQACWKSRRDDLCIERANHT